MLPGRGAFLGMGLAAVGLGTFWSVTVAGQDLARTMLTTAGLPEDEVGYWAKFAYGFVQTVGGGLVFLFPDQSAPASGGRKLSFCIMWSD
ncbi:MAG: hypothetical protein R3C11_10300 [Planctomycetaceae bacterium]